MALADFLAQLDDLCSAGDRRRWTPSPTLHVAGGPRGSSFSGQERPAQGRAEGARRGRQAPTSRPPASVSTRSRRSWRRPSTRPRRGWPSLQGVGPRLSQFDPTVPGVRRKLGRLHPLTQTIEELKDIMGRLGFTRGRRARSRGRLAQFRGPQHPARSPGPRSARQLLPGHRHRRRSRGGRGKVRLLRSQTSTVQIRVMEKTQAAGADHFARPRLSSRHGRRDALSDVPSDRRACWSTAT